MEKIIELKEGEIRQNKQVVLKDVNISIGTNEFVYLIGKTGSGKSSLLKTLYGELTLSNGYGEVAGIKIDQIKKKQIPDLRRKLGIVFQDFQLLSDRSIRQNLYFVMGASGWKKRAEKEKRAIEVLQLVGLETKIDKLPHELSGGEQQRIAIARALLNSPELILADEPTGNLDPETSEEIMQLLVAISREGRTSVLMATHDFTMMEKYPGRILKVENNTVKASKSINQFDPFAAFETE